MSASIEIQGLREVQALLNSFPQRAKTIISRSLNDAATHTVTDASRRVRQTWNLNVKEAKAGYIVVKSSPQTLESRVIVKGKPVPLMAFKPRQTKKGISVTIKKGHRTMLRSAFIATMRSGHVGVYKRVGRKRLPIRERSVVSYPVMVRGEWEEIKIEARRYLLTRLQQQIARALERRR